MKIGDEVKKVKGYSWPGVIVADFTNLNGDRRLVVECTVDEVKGALHIYSPEQLESVVPKKKVYAVAFDVPKYNQDYIMQGKMYEVANYDDKVGFTFRDDNDQLHYSLWDSSIHLASENWTRVEI